MPANTPPPVLFPGEPAPGHKTTIVAAVWSVLQALIMGGVVPDVSEPVNQVATGAFAITLGIKALRKIFGRSR